MSRVLLVTGSSGLIGSEVCRHFHGLGWEVHGFDNNQRAVFFGAQGDTRANQHRLKEIWHALHITKSISATEMRYSESWRCYVQRQSCTRQPSQVTTGQQPYRSTISTPTRAEL